MSEMSWKSQAMKVYRDDMESQAERKRLEEELAARKAREEAARTLNQKLCCLNIGVSVPISDVVQRCVHPYTDTFHLSYIEWGAEVDGVLFSINYQNSIYLYERCPECAQYVPARANISLYSVHDLGRVLSSGFECRNPNHADKGPIIFGGN